MFDVYSWKPESYDETVIIRAVENRDNIEKLIEDKGEKLLLIVPERDNSQLALALTRLQTYQIKARCLFEQFSNLGQEVRTRMERFKNEIYDLRVEEGPLYTSDRSDMREFRFKRDPSFDSSEEIPF